MKQKTKKKLIIAGAVAGVLAVIAGGIGLNKKLDNVTDTKALTSGDYVVCALNDETGKKEASTTQLTSGFIKAEDMKITADKFDGEVQINYYDEDKKFISMAEFEGEYEVPESAVYARIEILPNDDHDINLIIKGKIVDQVSVIYKK